MNNKIINIDNEQLELITNDDIDTMVEAMTEKVEFPVQLLTDEIRDDASDILSGIGTKEQKIATKDLLKEIFAGWTPREDYENFIDFLVNGSAVRAYSNITDDFIKGCIKFLENEMTTNPAKFEENEFYIKILISSAEREIANDSKTPK